MPSLSLAFRIIIFMRFTAAMYTGITDCDEGQSFVSGTALSSAVGKAERAGRGSVSSDRSFASSPLTHPPPFLTLCPRPTSVFNFWEPLHYLFRGTGFQTWELSPQFAVRSWAYIATFLPAAEIAPYWINLGKVRTPTAPPRPLSR